MIRVLLADDQALVRAGFAVRLVRELTPDVVLMDIRMPGLDGLQATHEIAGDGRLAGVRVVILTTFELDEYVFEALRAEALLSPSVTRRLISEFAAGAPVLAGAAAGRPAAIFGHPDITGDYLFAAAGWAPHAGQALDSMVLIKLKPGAAPGPARAAVTGDRRAAWSGGSR